MRKSINEVISSTVNDLIEAGLGDKIMKEENDISDIIENLFIKKFLSSCETREEAYAYGVKIAREKVAKGLLKEDYEIDMIHEVTGLSVEEIEVLEKSIIEIEVYKRYFGASS